MIGRIHRTHYSRTLSLIEVEEMIVEALETGVEDYRAPEMVPVWKAVCKALVKLRQLSAARAEIEPSSD